MKPLNTPVRDKITVQTVKCLEFSTCTGNASGLLSKKQYAVSAEQMFMMKLCIERFIRLQL